jgi:hypothetical protein
MIGTSVFSDGTEFSVNHNVLHATTNRQVELIDMEACGGARLISQI